MQRILFILIFLSGLCNSSFSQTVPSSMEFAGLKLKITDAARREIQKDVDMLTRSPKYFGIKVNRAKLYFPIIERIFKEENLPEDFKFLVLQESALISDAVSTSNAVGFWQFKKEAALEMGLRIDNTVDERINIVSSSRAAAMYLRKYNKLFFNNWLYALQSYQQGPGGTLRVIDKGKIGASKMVVDKKTYWYVKKYLAHKIAFQGATKTGRPTSKRLVEYTSGANKNLKDIARKLSVDHETIKNYNKWLKHGKIPGDKKYAVIVPVNTDNDQNLLALLKNTTHENNLTTHNNGQSSQLVSFNAGKEFPRIKKKKFGQKGLSYQLINGIPGTVAKENVSISALALRAGISTEKFREYNDLKPFDKIKAGMVYYFKKKKNRGQIHYYAVKANESLWSISQKFGIKLSKLLVKNRIKNRDLINPGRVLWLRFIRPSGEKIEYISIPQPEKASQQQLTDNSKTTDVFKSEKTGKPSQTDHKNTAITDEEKTSETVTSEVENKIEPEKKITYPIEKQTDTTNSFAIDKNEELQKVIDRKAPDSIDRFEVTEPIRFIGGSKPNATIKNHKKIHLVKKGETLFSIARTYDITVTEIRKWNALDENFALKFDSELIVGFTDNFVKNSADSENLAEDNKFILHEVLEGETLFKIAKDYEMTLQQLMNLNKKTDYSISIGEKLKVVKIIKPANTN